jgi:NADPH:quinone reductase-like Zn-dependent oxidoreductase
MFKPKKPILGTEFAGEIEVIGNKVSSFNVGDKVFGFEFLDLMTAVLDLMLNTRQYQKIKF